MITRMEKQTSVLNPIAEIVLYNSFMGVLFGTMVGCILALVISVAILGLQMNAIAIPANESFTYASLHGMTYGALGGVAFAMIETWRQMGKLNS